MNLNEVLKNYLPTLQADAGAFGPEVILCSTIVVILLSRVVSSAKFHTGWIALVGVGWALWTAYEQASLIWPDASRAYVTSREIFGGMLVYDVFSIFLKVFLLAFTALLVVLTLITHIPDSEDSGDFYTLLLGAVLGMSMMAAANHLLMVFLAVEMASVPSYAMAGFLKGRKQSSEAALKYVVYGGAAAGVMLYGISLLAGIFGTAHLPTLSLRMMEYFSTPAGHVMNPVLLLALGLFTVGLAFKLSAFPFHFWCPDVFEGAAAEVAAFLSVASKGAAIALLARIGSGFVGDYFSAPPSQAAWASARLAMSHYLQPTLAVIAAVTCTFGNLAAYNQPNLKRMLAYSTIAHAGYMMLGLVPLNLLGVQAALFYLITYLFMNLGAFAIIAFLRNKTGSENVESFSGLIHRAPALTILLCIFLISLVGMPPFAGFVAKFQIFAVLYRTGWYSLLFIGGLNTVISLVYYMNVVRIMVLQEDKKLGPIEEPISYRLFASVVAVPVIVFGIFWETPFITWSGTAAFSLKSQVGSLKPGISADKTKTAENPTPPVGAPVSAADSKNNVQIAAGTR